MSKASAIFLENKKDIDTLWEIHTHYAGAGVGKKDPKVEVLNRSAIIFITACWETYVEDIAKEAFEFIIDNCKSPLDIPSKVRDSATKPIFEQKNSQKIWDLADNGWKKVLTDHKEVTLDKWLGNFNTPKTSQVNNLFEELIGVKNISNNWYWQKMSYAQAAKKLDEFITVRGAIAHRTKHSEKIAKDKSKKYITHIESLVRITDSVLEEYLQNKYNIAPW